MLTEHDILKIDMDGCRFVMLRRGPLLIQIGCSRCLGWAKIMELSPALTPEEYPAVHGIANALMVQHAHIHRN